MKLLCNEGFKLIKIIIKSSLCSLLPNFSYRDFNKIYTSSPVFNIDTKSSP